MRTGFLLSNQTFPTILRRGQGSGELNEHKQMCVQTSHFKVNVVVFVNAFFALSLSARPLAAFKIGSLSGVDPRTGIIVW